MSLNDKPAAERVHIGFFGLRNAGKSSLVNAVTGQNLALVSDIKGTTTDPVQKTMELLPIGPLSSLTRPALMMKVSLAQCVLSVLKNAAKTDIAVLVADAAAGLSEHEGRLMRILPIRKFRSSLPSTSVTFERDSEEQK